MPEVRSLRLFVYWALLRDAVIYNYSKTAEGRAYLDDCWRLEQTEPEREKLRERYKGDSV